eukprot:scaffold223690_cov23-Prasinocladus_malaysianus.AAC.1
MYAYIKTLTSHAPRPLSTEAGRCPITFECGVARPGAVVLPPPVVRDGHGPRAAPGALGHRQRGHRRVRLGVPQPGRPKVLLAVAVVLLRGVGGCGESDARRLRPG